MALKDTWVDKKDGADKILAEHINGVAHELIDTQSLYQGGSSYGATQTGTSSAGGKGFKVLAVSETDSDTGTYTLSSVTGLQTGMEYAVNLASPYYGGGVITTVDGSTNTITVSGYHYTPLSTKGDNPDNFEIENYLVIPSRPDLGDTDIGFCANASGMGSIAQDKAARASGCDNVAAGKYADINGYKNKGGFCDHVEGYVNTAYGTISHVEGTANTESGSGNHVEGRGNTVNGHLSTVAGGENTVTGNLHDVSGQDHVVTGHRNTVRGQGHVPSGYLQTVIGQYAENDTDKAFILGWGNGKSSRKNIATVDRYGNLQIAGKFNNVPTYILQQVADDDFIHTFTSEAVIKRTCTFTQAEGSCYRNTLKFYTTGKDPNVTTTFYGDTSMYHHFKIRYKISNSGNPTTLSCKLYYSGLKEGPTEERMVEFDAVKDGKWHNEILAINTDNAVNRLRVDIPNYASTDINETVYIKYIGLFPSYDSAKEYLCDDETSVVPNRVNLNYDGANVGYMTYNMIVLNNFSWYSIINDYHYTLPSEFLDGLYKFYGKNSSSGNLTFEALAFMVEGYDCVNTGGSNIQYGNLQELVSGISIEIDDDENQLHLQIIGDTDKGYSVSKLIMFLVDCSE